MLANRRPLRLSEDEKHYYDEEGTRYDRVSTILKGTGVSGDFRNAKPYHMDLGRAVHKATELLDLGTLDEETVADAVLPPLTAYKAFLSDTGYHALGTEITVRSRSLRVAGTIDKVGILNGRLGIIDIKVTESVHPSADLQLCAYEVLWMEDYPDWPLEFRYPLQLTPRGEKELVTKWADTEAAQWIATVKHYRWLEKRGLLKK